MNSGAPPREDLVRGRGVRAWVLLLLAGCLLGGSGCTTAKKYRLAKDDTPPAVPLDWSVAAATEHAPVTLGVEHVITFKGPGSWKREARWDEFVLRMENHGDEPLVIESAELLDLHGVAQRPGTDPWALEKLSYTNWDKYGKTGLQLVAGAGGVVLYAGAVTAVGLGAALSGGAAAGAGAAALNIIPIVAVVNIGTVVVLNRQNKEKVGAEFERRRLVLPLEVAARSGRQGSWFFPMTPSPQALVVRGWRGGQPVELTLPLPELARLHLRPGK